MTKDEIRNLYTPDSKWFGRSLQNYKTQQGQVAKSKGILPQLLACQTLTAARKLIYGAKKGHEKVKKVRKN